MASSNTKTSSGRRRRYKGKTVLPTGMPRSSMGTAKIPGKTVRGPSGLCKPNVGFSKNPVFECGQKEPLTTKHCGRYKVSIPHNAIRKGGAATPITTLKE